MKPWTNVYGLARTLLALSTALTLLLNSSGTLFRPIAGTSGSVPFCATIPQRMGIFCLAASHLDAARILGVAGLFLVATGWRPRLTGLLHWWITVSFSSSASTIDGGDQAATVLSLFLIPITLTDERKWHWDRGDAAAGGFYSRLIAASSWIAIRVQVAAIYFHAAVAKMRVPEWEDGTAVYYWFNHPVFGANRFLMTFLRPLLVHSATVGAITWSVILLEFGLTMGLLASRAARRVLLPLGLVFHLAIIVIHGLASFAFTMFGALILYLRPSDEEFSFAWASRAARFVRQVLRLLHPSEHLGSATAATLEIPRAPGAPGVETAESRR